MRERLNRLSIFRKNRLPLKIIKFFETKITFKFLLVELDQIVAKLIHAIVNFV